VLTASHVTKLENQRPVHGKRGDGLLAITGFPLPFRRFSWRHRFRYCRTRMVTRRSRGNIGTWHPTVGKPCLPMVRYLRLMVGYFGTNQATASCGLRSVSATPCGRASQASSRHGRLDTRGWVLPSSDPEEIVGIAAGDPVHTTRASCLGHPGVPSNSGTGLIVRRGGVDRYPIRRRHGPPHLARSSQRSPDGHRGSLLWQPKVRCLKM